MRRIYYTLLLFSFPMLGIASSNQLSGMSTNPSRAATRLVFIFTNKPHYQLTFSKQYQRLMVQFNHTDSDFPLRPLLVDSAQLKDVQCEEKSSGNINCIITLKKNTRYAAPIFSGNEKDGVMMAFVFSTVIDKLTQQAKPQTDKNLQALQNVFQDEVKNSFVNNLPASKLPVAKSQDVVSVHKYFTVLIDPGHGGHDPGALGIHGTKEKDVVLKMARLLANKINSEPTMRAILTRDGDYFLPLRERLRLARQDKVDVFISVHADYYFNDRASGVSLYALSPHGATTEAARWLAQRENYSELSDISLSHLQDKSYVLRSVLIDLAQTNTIQNSIFLGDTLLSDLNKITSLHYTRTEQAPFVVLKSPDIPSVLVETGFLSNPSEERRLVESEYQQKIVQALFSGVYTYYNKRFLTNMGMNKRVLDTFELDVEDVGVG